MILDFYFRASHFSAVIEPKTLVIEMERNFSSPHKLTFYDNFNWMSMTSWSYARKQSRIVVAGVINTEAIF